MNKRILPILSLFIFAVNNIYGLCKTITINGFTINIKQGDIIKNETDVIVNPANSRLLQGGGLCGQIFMRSQDKGKLLKEALLAHKKETMITEVVKTDACGLEKFKKIYHVVPPNFNKYNPMQSYISFDKEGAKLLGKCYENILNKAVASGVKSVSIPFLAAGNFRRSFFDLPDMAIIAIQSIKNFCKLNKNTNLVIDFVFFDAFTYELVMHPIKSKIKFMMLKWHVKKMINIFRSMHEDMGEFEMSLFIQDCLKHVLIKNKNRKKAIWLCRSLRSYTKINSKLKSLQ